jgi:hypothetical protein
MSQQQRVTTPARVTKRTKMNVFVLWVTFVAFVAPPWRVSSHAQQQGTKPVFRVGAHFVSVDAYPTRDGRIVEGLSKDDFEIYEDDKPQKVETFEFISADARPPDDGAARCSRRAKAWTSRPTRTTACSSSSSTRCPW